MDNDKLDLSATQIAPIIRKGIGGNANSGRKRAEVEKATDAAHIAHANARAKKAVHDANIAELEEQRMRGELVPVAEVRKQAVQAARSVRELFLSLPSRLSALLADQPEPVVRERLDAEIRRTLEVIAEGFE